MHRQKYTIGIDFGTLSGRAVVVRIDDGEELASAEHIYEHGVLTQSLPVGGVSLPAQWALQVPEDYRRVLVSILAT
jgi:L-ribulokinase